MAHGLGMQEAYISYFGVSTQNEPLFKEYRQLFDEKQKAKKLNTPFFQQKRLEIVAKQVEHLHLYLAISSFLTTILIGTYGFIMLLLKGKRWYVGEVLSRQGWFWIFLALFWLFQTGNGFLEFLFWLQTGFVSSCSDEAFISQAMGLPDFSIILLTSLMGLFVLGWITRFLPAPQRFRFLLGGFVGDVVGYLFWFEWVGKLILP
jgi:hypothetical protein